MNVVYITHVKKKLSNICTSHPSVSQLRICSVCNLQPYTEISVFFNCICQTDAQVILSF